MQLSKRSGLFQEAIKIKQLEKIHQGGQFAIMSPYRWGGDMTHSKNKSRYTLFIQELQEKKYKYNESYGRWYEEEAGETLPDGKKLGKWTTERSMLIKGIPFDEARDFASKYNQAAFIHKSSDGPVVYYDLKNNAARPTEKIVAQREPEGKQKPPPDPERPQFRQPHDLTQPKKGKPDDPPKTVFRNVELLYDFDFSTLPFRVSDGPISWSTIQSRADEFAKTLQTKTQKPVSKYREKHPAEN